MKGRVTKTTGLWYEVRVENETVRARLRGKFKQENKKLTNPIAVGDQVLLELNPMGDGDWIILDILPRTNYVARESPKKKSYAHLVASNIDQALVLFTFHTPRTSIVFVDRFLVTLEAFRIPGIVVLNKQDLFGENELDQWAQYAQVYQSIGYRTFTESLSAGVSSELIDALHGARTLLAGHSGSGKSTLINQLVKSANQEIGDISGFANKGRHTTTFAQMFDIDSKSQLIDTPGIKELGLAEVEADELAHYFPEFRERLGACRFHNCTHSNEPGCAIKDGVAEGSIAEFRFDSYLNMLFSCPS